MELNLKLKLFDRDKKAIGRGFRTVGTVVPPSDSFAHFLSIASSEDNQRYITIRDPYLDNAWVYSCIQVMSSNLAQAPLTLYNGDNPLERSNSQYLWLWKLFNNVSPYMNKFALIESIIVWLSIRGECFWHLVRSQMNGSIVRIAVLEPDYMQEVVRDNEIIAWKYQRPDGRRFDIEAQDVIQFKYFNPYSKFRGLSPLTAAMLGLNIDIAAAAYNFYFFNNSASPSIVLSTEQEPSPEEADGILERFNKKQRGVAKAGASTLLTHGAKAQQLSLAQKDIEYINQRKWSREEVTSVLNVPPALVQLLENASIKSNIREQRQQLYENNLIPKAAFIEDVLRTEFFERGKIQEIRAEFDFSQVDALKEDFNKTLEQGERLQKLGFTANEINEKLELGFERKDWRDYWWIQFNMVPAGMEPPEPKKEPAKEPPKEPEKQVKAKRPNVRRLWDLLMRQTGHIEKAFLKDLQEYFYKLRQEVLHNVLNYKSVKAVEKATIEEELLFNLSEANIALGEIGKKHITEAYQVGIDSLEGINISFDPTHVRAALSIEQRVRAIKGINDTIREQLLTDFKPIIDRGLREGLAYENIAKEMADVARDTFNNARSRAATIARTETNGAMNKARYDTMEESGVEKHEWVASFVDTRPSHAAENGHVVRVGEPFPVTHLLHPLDSAGPPEEVINCQCIVVPYID